MHLWRYFSPEQALVFVGALTCPRGWLAGMATQRSASAMLDSIKLQQTQMMAVGGDYQLERWR